ncbi:MAG: pyridoxal phosphate-dependent aminotransferase [Thermoprotei archaeon]|jgi:aspartate aminotransferase
MIIMRSINKRSSLLRESPTRRIDRIREIISREGRDIYLLSTGQPSIPPPKEVREFLSRMLFEESMKLYGYTQSQGIRELREAIVNDLKELGGLDLDPDKNIVVTAGGQEAMFTVLSGILEPGDEVILMDPTYFGYRPLIEYFGGSVKYVFVSMNDGFQPDIEGVKDVIGPKTKALILVSPDNPTGRIIKSDVAKGLAELAREYDFWLIVDEAYKTLIYEGEHSWIWHFAPERVIGINTFSKDPGIPGWRLGYVYGPEDFIKAAKLISEEIVYCPPSIAQMMVAYYLKSGLRKQFMPKVLSEYRAKRDALINALQENLPNVKFVRPQGSMFLFADFSKYLNELGMNGETFSETLLTNVGVATVPGNYFGSAKDFIRLSFVSESQERIRRAIELIRKFIEERLQR